MKKRTTKRKAVKKLSPLKDAFAARDFKAELKRIVDFLNVGDGPAANLWNVLSALRGPDIGAVTLIEKRATTAVIRKTIGMIAFRVPAAVMSDSEDGVNRRLESAESIHGPNFVLNPITSPHFDTHARMAFETLGLKWHELNKPEVKI